MTNVMEQKVQSFMARVIAKNPGEVEFHQAVHEVVESLIPFVEENPQYKEAKILERMVEPERVILFRVPWINDKGGVELNKGYRIEMNSAIGPYKGGLRFHPTVNLGILKFLAFEQVLKNSLTTLPMGGGKGGSDFDPKGKSDNEVMHFCQSFMTELCKQIGQNTDVPAGDIGVGGREIGYMFGQYKRIRNEFVGVLTGKGIMYGGRFGNVAWGAALKAVEYGAKVVTISGPDGYVYDEAGITGEKINYLLELRASNNDVVAPYATEFPGAKFFPNERPWGVKVDIALPCATQNELNGDDAVKLLANGVKYIGEVSNMGCTPEAIEIFHKNQIPYGPGKAVNAGGVAVSGLEMSQNSMRLSWSREEVDAKLHSIMVNIHENCVKWGKEGDFINYVNGANIAGFVKVADAMLAQGVV